jgi:beta-lactamase class A
MPAPTIATSTEASSASFENFGAGTDVQMGSFLGAASLMKSAGCNLCAGSFTIACMRLLPCVLLLLLPASFAAAEESSAQREVAKRVLAFHGEMGVYAKNLDTGATIAVAPDIRFPTASLIKVAVMAEVFRQMDAGKLDRKTTVTLRDATRRETRRSRST